MRNLILSLVLILVLGIGYNVLTEISKYTVNAEVVDIQGEEISVRVKDGNVFVFIDDEPTQYKKGQVVRVTFLGNDTSTTIDDEIIEVATK